MTYVVPTPEVESLLPQNAGRFERVLSAITVHRLPPQYQLAALVRTLWNPWTIPAPQLPLLAWAWSVDIWNESWSIDRKRQVVAEARIFHMRKTTVAGYRMALGYVDAELVRAHLPKHAFFAGAGPTEESHERWLSGLPELRIYTADYKIKYRPVLFVTPGGEVVTRTLKGRFMGRFIAGSAKRVALGRRRAELRRDGSIRALAFSGVKVDQYGHIFGDPESVVIPGDLKNTFKTGHRLRGRFVTNGRLAGQSVIPLSFVPTGERFLANSTVAAMTPVDVEPRRLWEARPGGRGWFAGGTRRRGVRPNRADEQAFLSIRLADGTSVELGRMRNVLGKTRLRRKPFTAGLLVHAPSPPKKAFPVTGRFLRTGPERRIAEVSHALAVTAAARDTLFLNLGSVRALRWGDLARLPDNTRAGVSVRVR